MLWCKARKRQFTGSPSKGRTGGPAQQAGGTSGPRAACSDRPSRTCRRSCECGADRPRREQSCRPRHGGSCRSAASCGTAPSCSASAGGSARRSQRCRCAEGAGGAALRTAPHRPRPASRGRCTPRIDGGMRREQQTVLTVSGACAGRKATSRRQPAALGQQPPAGAVDGRLGSSAAQQAATSQQQQKQGRAGGSTHLGALGVPDGPHHSHLILVVCKDAAVAVAARPRVVAHGAVPLRYGGRGRRLNSSCPPGEDGPAGAAASGTHAAGPRVQARPRQHMGAAQSAQTALKLAVATAEGSAQPQRAGLTRSSGQSTGGGGWSCAGGKNGGAQHQRQQGPSRRPRRLLTRALRRSRRWRSSCVRPVGPCTTMGGSLSEGPIPALGPFCTAQNAPAARSSPLRPTPLEGSGEKT